MQNEQALTWAMLRTASSCSRNQPLRRPQPLPFNKSSYSSSSISHSSRAKSGPVLARGNRACTAALDCSQSRSLFQKGAVVRRRSSSCWSGSDPLIVGRDPAESKREGAGICLSDELWYTNTLLEWLCTAAFGHYSCTYKTKGCASCALSWALCRPYSWPMCRCAMYSKQQASSTDKPQDRIPKRACCTDSLAEKQKKLVAFTSWPHEESVGLPLSSAVGHKV